MRMSMKWQRSSTSRLGSLKRTSPDPAIASGMLPNALAHRFSSQASGHHANEAATASKAIFFLRLKTPTFARASALPELI